MSSARPSSATVLLSQTGLRVGKIGHGLMQMTLAHRDLPDDGKFASIKASLDLVQPGEKVILNTGEFYGRNPPEANLELLARFFDKYPDYRDRAFISVKGCFDQASRKPNCSPEYVRASVANCFQKLGNRKMDLFEPARLDEEVSVEDTVRNLKSLAEEGYFDHIGLSEVAAATLRRAQEVHPITLCEIEISPFSYEEETRKVIQAGQELGVTVLGYSPIGMGFLTGNFDPNSLSETDHRRRFPRFQSEVASKNKRLAAEITAVANEKGVSSSQLCIAWVASLGDHVVPLPGSSKVERTLENFASGAIVFSTEEKRDLDALIEGFTVEGGRYPDGVPLWS